ncbi:hypothetical protein [Sporomusa carbonis]
MGASQGISDDNMSETAKILERVAQTVQAQAQMAGKLSSLVAKFKL